MASADAGFVVDPLERMERTSTVLLPGNRFKPLGYADGFGTVNEVPSNRIMSGSEVKAAPRTETCMSTVRASIVPVKNREEMSVVKMNSSRSTPSGPKNLGVAIICPR